MLRVAVNVRALVPGKIGGLEAAFRYTMAELVGREDLRFTLITSFHNERSFEGWGSRVRRVRVREDQMPQALEQAVLGHDVLWCPFLFLDPQRPSIPAVTMIPDLQHVAFPEFFTRELLTLRLRRLRTTVAWSKRVLTISEYSKRHLVEVYHLPDEHVVVTPLGAGPEFAAPKDPLRTHALRAQHELPARYAVFPANAWPHKNHGRVFAALARYRERFGDPPLLVLTGSETGSVDLTAEARSHGVERHVKQLGYLPREDLPFLQDGASLVLFTTLFEGFGIPVAEAMTRGVPVVTSNTTSLPELAGDCALLVDPLDPDAIATAMHETITDSEATQARIARGRARIASFSYAVAAERTLQALRDAASAPASIVTAVIPRARPKVFVVTPSFNQGRFLRATIESVLAQDYPNLHYFVADGGSTDETRAILEQYGDRVRWVSAPDGGQAAAIANAWRGTDAEIVAWLNSDDTYLPGAVTAAVEHLMHHPDHAMVYGNAWYTDEAGKQTEPYPTKAPFDRSLLAGDCFVCQPTAFVRREVFQVIDLPDPALRYCMDYDLWIRLSERFGVGHLDRFLATSRMYAQNKTLGERDGVYEEILRVVGKHFGEVPQSWTLGYALHRCKRVVERFFWFLPTPLRRLVHAGLIARQRQKLANPPFADGWAGQRTRLELRPDAHGRVSIEGESPFWPYRTPLEIRVIFESRVVRTMRVAGRGPFRIEATLPGRRTVPAVVELECNRTFVPFRHGMNSDRRPLAFRLVAFASSPA